MKLLEAFNLRQSTDIAGNLGATELELGLFRDAAEHFSYSLRTMPASADPQKREATKTRLATAKEKVGTLTIKVNVEGATVFIGDKAIGLSPLPAEAYVDPGSVTIRATADEYQGARQTLEVQAGSSAEVSIELTKKTGPTPAEPAPTPVVDRDDAAVAPSGSPGPVVRVSPDGDGDHETVAAAVHSATAGTTVLIGPGRYEGPVVIAQDGIRLVAEGEVLMTTENEPCVVVNGIGCVLTGVALVRRGKKDGAVVQVVAGDLLLEHCDVSGSGAGSVVGVDGPKTTVHLRHATIRDCYSGVAAARMTIEDSHLVALGQTGVDAVRAEWLEMTDTRIESVRRAGIAIGSTAATLGKVTARVSRCEIVGCGDSIGGAVEVGRHSTLELVDSRIERAEGFGLHVAKTGEADVADTMFLSIGQRFLRDKNAKPYRGAVKLAKDGVLRLRGVTVDGHPIEEGG